MPDPVRGVNAADALNVNSAGAASGGQAASGSGQAPSTTAPPVDSADVTQAEALRQTIGTLACAVPAADQARVAQFRQSIASGSYQVNPQAIAEKMMKIEQLLTGSSSKSDG